MCSTLSKTITRRSAVWAMAAVWAALLLAVSAQAAEKKPQSASDEDAIRAEVKSYVEAYNRGDAKALAAHWSDTGEWISPSGQRFQGKQAIQRELEALFAENQGVRIEVMDPTVRFVSPDVAIEEGTVRVIAPSEPPSDSTYLAVHVKKGGHWKLDSVHETAVPEAPAANSPLQDLAWLVGEWVDESPEATVETRVTWTKNQTFLNYAFKATVPGADDLEGTQVIGWDPAAGTIRSWMFDSDGGFGEGTWSQKGDSWIVKFTQVLPDGRKAAATNIYTLVDANTFTWRSIGREVDGQFQPNVEDVKVVRKGALEASKPAQKPRKPEAKKK